MKKILVLGAGLVSGPGVTYLLRQKDLVVTVASRTVAKAQTLVRDFPNGRALPLDIEHPGGELSRLIRENDIVVSLLPWVHHAGVAAQCLENRRHMVTTSYVSEGMKKLDPEAKKHRLLFLNEIGVDPGIDHMSAKKIIDEVYQAGGVVLHFNSDCGGLPAPESNDNPFGYKFSWSPRGVLLASKNRARYLEDGKIVEVEGRALFHGFKTERIEELGTLEIYPNRDSLPYRDIYGLKDALTVKRGTYRYPGWCTTLKNIVALGLVDDTPRPHLRGLSCRQIIAGAIGAEPEEAIVEKTAGKLGLAPDSEIIQRLEWLGLFSEEIVPEAGSYLDVLCHRMEKKLFYREGERDMLILKHTFIIENRKKTRERITSTLIDFGLPHGDTSMARTVSLPMAIATRLLAEEKIPFVGVQIPVHPEIYRPVLSELEKLGIRMEEKRMPWKP